MVGTTISHYKVTEKIGQGGMGEVYRATDTKLNRDVALKILPEQFASDSQRMGRFQREAEVLASLDHPNIGQIYGIEDAGQTKALVLQLIEGPTLAERIAQGPIPVEEALKIALQMAEGLEAAHEKGVIHRDLKPANIKITPEGQVKILDFGLAKALEGEAPAKDFSQSPTLTNAATQAGVILGTAAYMSPEQARGEATDKTADVWALGCVLFEMLTGRITFGGKTVSDVLAGVLRIDPEWKSLPPNLHPQIQVLLERSLEKESKDRYQGIADARVDIQKALADRSGVLMQPVAEVIQVPQRRILPWVLAVVLGAITAGVAVWAWLGSAPPPSTKRFTLTLPDSDALPVNAGGMLAVSPDGGMLVYRATRDGVLQLFRRPLDQFEPTPMQGTGSGDYPFFSPDGQWVGFWADGALQKVSLAGGPPQKLTALPSNNRGASWGLDDLIVFGPNNPGGSLMKVSAAGGDATALFTPDDQQRPWYPQILPGRDAVLFTLSDQGPDSGELHLLILGTGEHRTVVPNAVAGHVLDTGHLVFLRSGSLWAVPFDLDRLEMVGNPVPVVEGVRVEGGGAVQFAIAGDGTLIYVPGSAVGANNILALADRNGAMESLDVPPMAYVSPRLSPDGSRLVVEASSDERSDIWVYDLAGDTQIRRLTLEGNNIRPIWTPDGERVTFASDREGTPGIYWQLADGSGVPERLTTAEEGTQHWPESWSPDGETLLVVVVHSATEWGISTLSQDGETMTLEVFANEAESSQRGPKLSPEGQWLAYYSNESGGYQVYVQPFPKTGAKHRVTQQGGLYPLWSPDGKELLYFSGGQVMGVDVATEPAFAFGNEQVLGMRGFVSPGGGIASYDITPDGQQFLMIFPADQEDFVAEHRQINIVLNWFEELKERVPVP